MGAMVAKSKVAEAFTRGTHASTFGGNPVACAAAVAALDVMQAEGFLSRSVRMGELLVSSLMGSDVSELFKEIRIKGLMIGLELSKPIAAPAVALAREKGLLANAIGESIIRLLPPLVVSEDEIRQAVDILQESLKEACDGCLG